MSPPAVFEENPAAQAWQDFRDSLPNELPTLGQAAAVYDRIKIALRQFQAQLTKRGGAVTGVKNWMTIYRQRA